MCDVANTLIKKIESRKAIIGIIGLGYVGLPLAISYSKQGFKVIGFDVDKDKCNQLMEGVSYIEHIDSQSIRNMLENGFKASSNFKKITEVDAILVCVPTPLNKYREPDLSFVIDTIKAMLPFLSKGKVVSLESTTYPGTTDEELFPRLDSVCKVGEDIFLVYSPEREDPGNHNFNTINIPKIVGGFSKTCLEVGTALYSVVIEKVVPVSSTKAAEMTKLLENIHRAVNIGLVNEMKIVCDRMGIDIFEVIDAAATKPFGFTPFYPGPGLGGHCIPIDPFYLTWKAREFKLNTRFIELSGEVNANMPRWVVEKTSEALNQKGKSMKGSLGLVLGIAYKRNVDDVRESPAIEILELLQEKGVIVSYSDPHISSFPKMRKHHFDLNSIDLNPENVSSFDFVLLITDHDEFDYELISKYANLIVDTRGKFSNTSKNIVRA